MRWVPSGVLVAVALAIVFKCFFDYGQEWLMIPAAILFFLAIAINLNVPSDEPQQDAAPGEHSSHH